MTGVPASSHGLLDGATAGGDLTGTYPSPTVAAAKITAAKMSSGAATVGQLPVADGAGAVAYGTVTALIAESVLGSAAAAIDFSGIPATFRHLRLVVYGRSDQAAVQQEQLDLRMNGDAGTNYIWQTAEGFDAGTFGNAADTQDGIRIGELPAATALASFFGIIVLDVPYYATTVAFKSVVAHGHNARLGTAATLDQKLQAGCWLSTAAINRLNIHLDSGNNLITGSRASLYGVG